MMSKTIKELGAMLISLGLVCGLVLCEAGVAPAFAQHEGHNMPGMTKKKPAARQKGKAVRKKKRITRRRRRPAPKPQAMEHLPGMHQPGHQMPSAPSPQASPDPHANMPGHQMPASPAPKSSPEPAHMNMPGHQMPVSPAPQASPEPHAHMPGMPMPSASPAPSTAPSTDPHADMNMPTPAASPGAQPEAMKHDAMDHSKNNSADMKSMPGTGSMNMGPLMVMSGDDMGIRVGSSDTNIMSMGQMGSGTSWAPASTPMYMIHKQSGDWLLMLHYNAVVGVNSQGGPRGVTKFESANWLMPMAFHKLGKGTVQLRGMFSFEPFTFPPGGSPLLFQTGETYKGEPIIDRQHPHDLFMELSAQYTHPLGERGTWFAYFGYPGEPALGPTAFMHRASASENSSAVLSHHLMDSSHITFGVLTTGITYRWFKLEGSIFNGREPDENRYNFDAHPWTSRSARLSFAPNANWSMQVSHGLLRNPEAQEPGDVRRTTASISYNRKFDRGNWATSLVWGRNYESHDGEIAKLNGYIAESTVNFFDKNYLYTRLELVDKNALLRAVDRALLGITDYHPSFRIGAYTFGGARDIWNTDKISMAIGSDLTFYSKPAVLNPIYGSHPVSWKIFLRLRPAKMNMGSTHGSH